MALDRLLERAVQQSRLINGWTAVPAEASCVPAGATKADQVSLSDGCPDLNQDVGRDGRDQQTKTPPILLNGSPRDDFAEMLLT